MENYPHSLRIGHTLGDDNVIKELHERCDAKPWPHLHVIATKGPRCISFPEEVAYQRKRKVSAIHGVATSKGGPTNGRP